MTTPEKTYWERYSAKLKELMDEADPLVVEMAKVWTGPNFGKPGWGSIDEAQNILYRMKEVLEYLKDHYNFHSKTKENL